MKSPSPPLQQPISGDIPLQWKQYFSQLELLIIGLPKSKEPLQDFANDAAASAGGVVLYGYYRTGSTVKQRVV